MMHIILLSGGSGKRLWPLSSNERPKQFIKALKAPDGSLESMVQRVYRQIQESGIHAHITIATGSSQIKLIHEQLGTDIAIAQEPERRDTFPAIALSCASLYEKGVQPNDVVAVMPIDPYCELSYFSVIQQMGLAAYSDFADIMLMGITPTSPSEKYGYMVPDSLSTNVPQRINRFVEKPSSIDAMRLIHQGAMWNGGVFVFRLKYMVDYLKENYGINSLQETYDRYSGLPKMSFDYAVVEKAKSVGMVVYDGYWEDLGTWSAMIERIDGPTIGDVRTGEGTIDTNIINELDVPIIALGVRDLVIVASKEGILVTRKEDSANLKDYVDKAG
jgi:mannose-1-phosphate guanylyltransferase